MTLQFESTAGWQMSWWNVSTNSNLRKVSKILSLLSKANALEWYIHGINLIILVQFIVSNSIWAFATIGFGAAQTSIQFNTNNEYICLPSDQAEEDRLLVTNTLDIVAKSAMERLPRFRPQELNNLAWGFCRLGHHNALMDELFDGIGKELMRRHHYFKPQVRTTLLKKMRML